MKSTANDNRPCSSNLLKNDPATIHEFRLELYVSGGGKEDQVYLLDETGQSHGAVEDKRWSYRMQVVDLMRRSSGEMLRPREICENDW